ncbi:branched-chain amino acid ABC transporter permease [Flexivirga caeni]|uniref:Branched-chain amino acid ABC transporter permease n=1 Tax=Flexivirga caeni TaxID=2294115 RepID=A0A3M9MIS8_9MICO|nr:branched-chain amino acid ABC transporter permease [Flexivirga caeni]RNI25105.1 branched-chain amino acid ABC transporter permease [Flexivirga caeni]
MSESSIITNLIGILTTASTLFMVAAGLTLVFGALRLINIAHGSFYMYGAYLATTLAARLGGAGFWVSLVICPLVVAAMGVLVEVLVLRRLYRREHLTQLLATFALLLIFADIALRLWGKSVRSIKAPSALNGHFQFGGAAVPVYDLFVIGVAALVAIGLWALMSRSKLGWRVRAVVDDPEVLAASGTNVPLILTGVFALGAMLAGLSGVVIAPEQAVQPGMDAEIIVAAFIVAVIGGLGSIVGAAIGSLIIGVVETLGAVWTPSWASTFIYALMILVLAIRPWGLFGETER